MDPRTSEASREVSKTKQNKTKQNGSIGDPRVAECHVARVLLGSVSSKSKARVTYSCGQIKSGLSI